jgi:hypothetical protein
MNVGQKVWWQSSYCWKPSGNACFGYAFILWPLFWLAWYSELVTKFGGNRCEITRNQKKSHHGTVSVLRKHVNLNFLSAHKNRRRVSLVFCECVQRCWYLLQLVDGRGPPLCSSGQSSWLLTQRSRVRFPPIPDFLSSSVSGTESIQPREDKWGSTWKKSSSTGLENWD